ncbi:dihydrolipoyl dehydrogenase family protein [Leuconostoc pseudomesenteroides]|uniref:dihydrolipoyl dehydrogenase family protein n=1 Tax=Leuconostoc pseudomesenteroides TaxID=33968 RepID=UPI0039ED914D
MAQYQYDVGVIGAGPAGLAAAFAAKSLGKSVVIIEQYLWGGTCPNYGCDPKKILLSAVEGIRRQSTMQGRGLQGYSKINWSDLMAYKQGYVDAVEPRKVRGLDEAGITRLYGHSEFINTDTVSMTDNDDTIKATDWVIAVGQRPKKLDFPGSEFTQDSEDFLNLPDLPDDVTFIGAGYVGVEFATITNAAGAHTRVVTHGHTALRDFDQTLVQQWITETQEAGFDWYFDATVVKIEQTDTKKLLVSLDDGTQFQTDRVFVTAGRVGNADKLGLETAGITYNEADIPVDDYLRTSNPHVYAIGDVGGSPAPKLVPTGNYEGRYVAQLIAQKITDPIAFPTMPAVVFGSPRIAQTGISVKEAEELGYRVTDVDMSQVITFYRYHDNARIRTVLDQNGRVAGASVIAMEAEELINYFVTAINDKRTLADTQANIYAYPSLGSEFGAFY